MCLLPLQSSQEAPTKPFLLLLLRLNFHTFPLAVVKMEPPAAQPLSTALQSQIITMTQLSAATLVTMRATMGFISPPFQRVPRAQTRAQQPTRIAPSFLSDPTAHHLSNLESNEITQLHRQQQPQRLILPVATMASSNNHKARIKVRGERGENAKSNAKELLGCYGNVGGFSYNSRFVFLLLKAQRGACSHRPSSPGSFPFSIASSSVDLRATQKL